RAGSSSTTSSSTSSRSTRSGSPPRSRGRSRPARRASSSSPSAPSRRGMRRWSRAGGTSERSPMSGPLLAVDTPSMLFRAFYALPKSIVGPDGNPVNALLGAANLILREVEAHDPRAVVLCFGPDAASYRTELFPQYHADRDEVPDELAP